MKAIVHQGEPGKASLVTDRPYPRLRPGYVLVDVKAVALNPTDWKHIDYQNSKGAQSGCDFAGVVAETGIGYSKAWQKGDRICGFAHGANCLENEDGSFAERIAVKADLAFRIPDNISFADASTLGVGLVTCAQGLFQQMGLNVPSHPTTKGELILIYGGSSATGMLGIQFAKLAGYTPIATCSPSNFELVKALGAVAVFDYRDEQCAAQINSFTKNALSYVWDTIGSPDSVKICAEVISPGGSYGAILKLEFPRSDVKTTYSLGYTAIGETIEKRGVRIEARPDHFEFMKKWVAEEGEPILQEGRLKLPPTQVGSGLEGVLDGLDLMRQGKVSGTKLVYVL
ncbi:zinc-binding oxidoreductase alcohol dehydrogenase [Thozetella sp. PMI_491]|nr:zinc-binding oxidoreductase alcohol dehydrogenase [Thozetella sp. PMI_491]